MYAFFEYLNTLPILSLFLLFLLENAAITFFAVLIGFALDGLLFEMKRLITIKEMYWACSTIIFNTVITLIGYKLFQYNYIVFNLDFSLIEILIDFIVLVIVMDFLMYIFHWAIHKLSFIYKYHDLHHHYNKPTTISLFVLHPLEVVGFGTLWLCLLMAIDFSIYATIVYLIFNVAMGVVGHLRKEVVPDFIKNNILLQWLANTGFHVDHHQDENHNFGFYTKVWDRLFGTLK